DSNDPAAETERDAFGDEYLHHVRVARAYRAQDADLAAPLEHVESDGVNHTQRADHADENAHRREREGEDARLLFGAFDLARRAVTADRVAIAFIRYAVQVGIHAFGIVTVHAQGEKTRPTLAPCHFGDHLVGHKDLACNLAAEKDRVVYRDADHAKGA